MSVFDAFQTGAAVGKRKAPFSGVLDSFKTRQENEAKLQGELGLKYAENQLPLGPKEKAEMDLTKKKSAWIDSISNGGSNGLSNNPDFVVDRVGPSGPTFVNQKSRTALKTAGSVPVAQAETGAETMLTQINDLKSLVSSGAKIPGSLPFGGFTKEGQRYQLIKKDISDRLLRLRSGAQINEQEYNRLSGLFPSIFRQNDVDLEQLGKFENEMRMIVSRLGTGGAGRADMSNDATNTSGGFQVGDDPAGLFD